MAVFGSFDSNIEPAPFVWARVHLPMLQTTERVKFLVDTGASVTTIHSHDARRLGALSQSSGQESVSFLGIGGSANYVQETARVSLYDQDLGAWRYFTIRIALSLPEDPQEAAAARGSPRCWGATFSIAAGASSTTPSGAWR